MDLSTLVTSATRTGVPMLVGVLVSWLASKGLNVDANTAVGLVAFLTALSGWVYYLVARMLEMKYPKFGWLLGSPKTLSYKK